MGNLPEHVGKHLHDLGDKGLFGVLGGFCNILLINTSPVVKVLSSIAIV